MACNPFDPEATCVDWRLVDLFRAIDDVQCEIHGTSQDAVSSRNAACLAAVDALNRICDSDICYGEELKDLIAEAVEDALGEVNRIEPAPATTIPRRLSR